MEPRLPFCAVLWTLSSGTAFPIRGGGCVGGPDISRWDDLPPSSSIGPRIFWSLSLFLVRLFPTFCAISSHCVILRSNSAKVSRKPSICLTLRAEVLRKLPSKVFTSPQTLSCILRVSSSFEWALLSASRNKSGTFLKLAVKRSNLCSASASLLVAPSASATSDAKSARGSSLSVSESNTSRLDGPRGPCSDEVRVTIVAPSCGASPQAAPKHQLPTALGEA
mmetsp:Transcript_75118/g.197903  ORF Transcript_75118/g.197903 Transcript_75118/m.197903 type:complete len:222 (-) Transcript_75118:135-800(-)